MSSEVELEIIFVGYDIDITILTLPIILAFVAHVCPDFILLKVKQNA